MCCPQMTADNMYKLHDFFTNQFFMPVCNQLINSRNMSPSDGEKLEDTSTEK